MIIEARTNFGHRIFREIMVCAISWFGRKFSKMNLAWFVPKLSRLQRDPSQLGEIAYSVTLMFSLFCYWAWLPCTFPFLLFFCTYVFFLYIVLSENENNR